MLPLWIQWVGGAAFAVALTALVALGASIWKRLVRMELSMGQVRQQANSHLTLTGGLIAALNRHDVISRTDMGEILGLYAQLGHLPSAPPNPLSPYEQIKLDQYIALARAGGPFTVEQVHDYKALVDKLEEEAPNDPNVWPLVALAAFLIGLYLYGKSQE